MLPASEVAVRFNLPSVALLSLLAALAGGLASGVAPRPSGPHDGPGHEPDVADVWLPRHRQVLESRRHAYPSARLPEHRAPGIRFRRPRRISRDILAPPPPELAGAQAETQTEPYVAVNPEDPDHLLAGWQETRFLDGAARALGVAVSTNGGRTWTEALLPGLTVVDGGEWPRASDPWPAFGPDGIAYYNSLLVTGGVLADNAVAVSVSLDGGFTWGDPVEVVRDSSHVHDKNSMIADTRAASPHRGNVYVGWDVNVKRDGQFISEQRMVVSRSTDQGASWRRPKRLIQDDVNIGIVLRVAPDGTVYAVWAGAAEDDPTLSVRFSRSTSGGRRFTRPDNVADLLAIGVPGYRSGAILPSFDVDPTTGDLFVVWPDARFSGVDQAALIVSRDGGATWSDPVRVNDGPPMAPVHTVGVAANGAGEVVVGYYTLRNDPTRTTMLDYYVNRSTDGGRTFERGVRVTRKTFDATFAARSGQDGEFLFLGDYVGLAGTDDGFAAVFTAPLKRSRLGPGRQPDIFGAASR